MNNYQDNAQKPCLYILLQVTHVTLTFGLVNLKPPGLMFIVTSYQDQSECEK